MLHRLRGVRIGRNVFIGDDVYLDNEYPEAIEIGDDVQISIRAVIIAHTRGPGRVIVGKEAFIGPQVIVACSAGRVIRIGEGAVVSAGCVVTRTVPPHVVLTPARAEVAAHASVSLSVAETMEQFTSGLRPLKSRRSAAAD
jgi:acetyltransferase-like isoleucine patch superfamily enzyme